MTLPCTLWFFDRGKGRTARADRVLFIDARHLYRQIDRAHRDWTPAQIEFLANIARLYRGERPENLHDSADLLSEHFPAGEYADVAGLCKAATLSEIEAQGWSLNPGRYVGVSARAEDDFDFKARLNELGKNGFEEVLERYKAGKPIGQKELRRVTDCKAGAVSPMKLYGVPVGKMFFQGAVRLLDSGLSIHPVRRVASENRHVVEAYPKLVAQSCIGGEPYKSDNPRVNSSSMTERRRQIVDTICAIDGNNSALEGTDK